MASSAGPRRVADARRQFRSAHAHDLADLGLDRRLDV
jgi:hypothetical protein